MSVKHLGKRTRKHLAQQEDEDAEDQSWENREEKGLDILLAEVVPDFHQVYIQNLNAGSGKRVHFVDDENPDT